MYSKTAETGIDCVINLPKTARKFNFLAIDFVHKLCSTNIYSNRNLDEYENTNEVPNEYDCILNTLLSQRIIEL